MYGTRLIAASRDFFAAFCRLWFCCAAHGSAPSLKRKARGGQPPGPDNISAFLDRVDVQLVLVAKDHVDRRGHEAWMSSVSACVRPWSNEKMTNGGSR